MKHLVRNSLTVLAIIASVWGVTALTTAGVASAANPAMFNPNRMAGMMGNEFSTLGRTIAGFFQSFTTQKLCLTDATASSATTTSNTTCITKTELDAILTAQSMSPITTATPATPQIQISGPAFTISDDTATTTDATTTIPTTASTTDATVTAPDTATTTTPDTTTPDPTSASTTNTATTE